MEPITSRDELKKLLDGAQSLADKGYDVPWSEVENAVNAYYKHLLANVICHGKGSDQDVIDLVGHHWPHLAKQEVAVDYWQARLIRHVLEGRYTDMKEVFVKGCTGAGKGGAAAIAACLWYETGDECKVVITSDTSKHAEQVMFAEIVRFRKKMQYSCWASHGATTIKTRAGKYMTVANPESTESFSGQHSVATLFIFDEASNSPEEMWLQAETQAAMSVALSNPRPNSSWFKRAFPVGSPDKTQVIDVPGGRRSLITIGGNDCINVKTGRRVIPAQITREKYQAIKERKHPGWWGRVMGDGMFADEAAARILIPPRWLERHVEAWTRQVAVEAFGLDVARSESGDRTVLATGGPGGCRDVLELKSVDTMEVVGWVLHTVEQEYGIDLKQGRNAITVDMDGLGSGVGDRLKEQGVWVLEFRGNATSEADSRIYQNLRAEGYGELSRRLDPQGAYPDEPWALPRDEELFEELTAPERIYSSDGVRYRITPKTKPNSNFRGETIYQKIGRSPDKADAVSYLYYAVRLYTRHKQWHESLSAPFIASGENPRKEAEPLTKEEVDELPDYLRDIVEHAMDRSWDQGHEDD